MKFLTIALLGLSLISTPAKAAEVASAVGAGLSITFLTYSGAMSAASCAQAENVTLCSIEVIGGHLALSSTTIMLLKENVEQIETDGMNVMAGEPMSLALEEIIQQLRAESDKLEGVSDLEIVGMLLQASAQ